MMPSDVMTKADVDKGNAAMTHLLRSGCIRLLDEAVEIAARQNSGTKPGRSKRASSRLLQKGGSNAPKVTTFLGKQKVGRTEKPEPISPGCASQLASVASHCTFANSSDLAAPSTYPSGLAFVSISHTPDGDVDVGDVDRVARATAWQGRWHCGVFPEASLPFSRLGWQ